MLLRRSFALIVGLWQMSWSHARTEAPPCGLSHADFPVELSLALRALWEGTIGRALPTEAAAPALAEERA